jgi:hypothetical protein
LAWLFSVHDPERVSFSVHSFTLERAVHHHSLIFVQATANLLYWDTYPINGLQFPFACQLLSEL